MPSGSSWWGLDWWRLWGMVRCCRGSGGVGCGGWGVVLAASCGVESDVGACCCPLWCRCCTLTKPSKGALICNQLFCCWWCSNQFHPHHPAPPTPNPQPPTPKPPNPTPQRCKRPPHGSIRHPLFVTRVTRSHPGYTPQGPRARTGHQSRGDADRGGWVPWQEHAAGCSAGGVL